jgi:protein-tyrosine phosphatase
VSGPVVATSAATEGVGRADQIAQDLDGKVDLVIDAGPPKYSKPSTLLRVRPDGYEIVRAGVYDARIIERLLKTTILFLCSGNTCRSPMAEGIARRLVAEKLQIASEDLENKGVSVISAGSFAIPGARATPQAVDVLKDLGIDLSRHRSRPLTVELINQADVIFTMGQSHVAAVAALVPSAVHKVQSLDPQRDIDDPIGGDVELYRELARQLRALIEQRLRDMPLP